MCCAVVAVIFCQMLHFFEHEIPKLLPNPWVRAAAGGAAVVALSYLMGVGRYNGAGMDVIMDAVELEQALPWDFVCKMVLTVLTLSVGFKGGEVVPSFYIGQRLAAWWGRCWGSRRAFLLQWVWCACSAGRPIRWWLPLYWRLSCSAGPGLS